MRLLRLHLHRRRLLRYLHQYLYVRQSDREWLGAEGSPRQYATSVNQGDCRVYLERFLEQHPDQEQILVNANRDFSIEAVGF